MTDSIDDLMMFLLNLFFLKQVESLYPQTGWVEIDPDVLWVQFIAVIKDAVKGNWIYENNNLYSILCL